jgi:hypothetical protein
MPSRVIHIRVDDWVLLGCHDLIEAAGKSTVNLSMSTIVRDVLTAFVRKMQQNEDIPFYSREQIMDRLEELYKGELDIDIAFNPTDLFDIATTPQSEISAIAQEAADIIAGESEPEIVSDKVVNIADSPKKKEKTILIDIFKQPAVHFSKLQKQAPKDRFIEQAKELEDPIFTQAVRICYTNLGKDLWGSEEAGAIIMDLVKRHNAK